MTEQVRWLDRRLSYEHLLPELTRAELLVLMVLERFGNNSQSCAWPSRATIAEKARVAEKTVTRALLKLVSMGIIKVARESTVTTPTAYFVGPQAVAGALRNVPRGGTKLCPPGGDKAVSPEEIREERSTRDHDDHHPVGHAQARPLNLTDHAPPSRGVPFGLLDQLTARMRLGGAR